MKLALQLPARIHAQATLIAVAIAGFAVMPSQAGQASASFRVSVTLIPAAPAPGSGAGGGTALCRTDQPTQSVDCITDPPAASLPPVTPAPGGSGGIVPVVPPPPVAIVPVVPLPPVAVIPGPAPVTGSGNGGIASTFGALHYWWRVADYGKYGSYDYLLGAFAETRMITEGGRDYLEMTVGW